jgi:hypothetical protein
MATALQQDDESQPTTSGASGTVSTTSGAGGQAAASAGNGPAATPSPSTGSRNTQAINDQIASLNSGADSSQFSSFLNNQGSAAQNAVNTAASNFTSSLGAKPTFGASDQATINAAINGTGAFQTAHDLLNKTYTGPTAIDRSQYDPQTQAFQQAALNLRNATGQNALESQIAPGTTQGDRNFDWLVYGGNKGNTGYQNMAKAQQANANTVAQSGDQAAANASGQVAQRQQDIAAFNTAAKGYVTDQMNNLSNLLNTEANQFNAANAAAAQNYQNFLKANPAQTFTASQQLPSGYALPGGSEMIDPANQVFQVNAPIMTLPSTSTTVDPRQYASYTPGSTATAQNIATQDQVNQYNVMQALLDQFSYMNAPGTAPTAASFNVNQAALSQALANAAAQQNQTLTTDQALAKGAEPYNEIIYPELAAMYGDTGAQAMIANNPGSGVQNADGTWYVPSADQLAAIPVPATAAGASDIPPAATSEGGMARGGVVRPRSPGALKPGPVPNPLNSMGGKGLGPQPQIAPPASIPGMPPSGLQDNASVLNPIGQVGYRSGGKILPGANTPMTLRPNYQGGGGVPMSAGLPGVTDSVPANLNAGEFVIRRPSAAAAGQQNLDGLNALANAPAAKQAMVRDALHAALSKAARG